MYEFIKRHIVPPLTTRLGTFIAGCLAPFGVHAEIAQMITLGIIGVLLLACDFTLAELRKRKIITDVLDSVIPTPGDRVVGRVL